MLLILTAMMIVGLRVPLIVMTYCMKLILTRFDYSILRTVTCMWMFLVLTNLPLNVI
jgi:hypothetical protein